jgi:Uri superfamily endonuclease
MAHKQDPKTQSQVVHKNQVSVVNPLYMTYIGSSRKVHVSERVTRALEHYARELNHLPEEIAVAWLEQMLELHNFNETNFYEK